MNRSIRNRFNRGEIAPTALARDDIARLRNTAALMKNWFPLRLGPMQYRPGIGEFLDSVSGAAYFVPFVKAVDDTALLEFTDDNLRVWVDDEPITYPAATASIANGDFSAGLTHWTDASIGLHPVEWDSAGYAVMFSDTYTPQLFRQTRNVQTGQEHTIKVVTLHSKVTLRIGTTTGGDEIAEEELLPGTHYLTFTPNSSPVTFQFSKFDATTVWIDEIDFYGGDLNIPTGVAAADLPSIRYAQSADVVFIAAENTRMKRVERRGTKSWSVVDFLFKDGPFRPINTSSISFLVDGTEAIASSYTLTSNEDFFKPDHVGAVFGIIPELQEYRRDVYGDGVGTGGVKVVGYGTSARLLTINISNYTTGVINLQRSLTGPDETDEWTDVVAYTSNTATTHDDSATLDGVTAWYRLFVKAGVGVGGTPNIRIRTAATFSTRLDFLVLEYNSPTSVTVAHASDEYRGTHIAFAFSSGIDNWFESAWSDFRGWPTAVALQEGRLWFAGRDNLWGSQSDIFDGFDIEEEGAGASIQKTIAFGPVETVDWLAPATRLIIGTASDLVSARSNAFGEPLSPTNLNLKSTNTLGTAARDYVKIDDSVFFVQRSQVKLYELLYSPGGDSQAGSDLTVLNPDICDPGIKRFAVSRQPETRVFVVLDDGTARVYLTDPAEEVTAWSRIETDGTIEDVVVLPGTEEDRVYWLVNRAGGRYLEKQALMSECIGASRSNHLDSHVKYTSPGTTITGLSHLNGETVTVWADGQDRGTFTVSGGSITVPSSWTDVTVGLAYTADYRSNKLREYLNQVLAGLHKRVTRIAFDMLNVLPSAIQYGPDENNLDSLPLIKDGTTYDQDVVLTDYEELPVEFDGSYDVDSRVFLRATGPATVLALMLEVDDPNYSPAREE